ncbi:pIIIa [Red-eared slider adenovirus 1]|uniref:pIIIa n=1 Tax=Red-eared slider adenovirus 1 TaxID=2749458 RepID=UPI002481D02C|nr:pIIIa [Red-eared slider adenovirus 1]QLD29001.1 pIIIa [Red-eared slider adenovirus 1]
MDTIARTVGYQDAQAKAESQKAYLKNLVAEAIQGHAKSEAFKEKGVLEKIMSMEETLVPSKRIDTVDMVTALVEDLVEKDYIAPEESGRVYNALMQRFMAYSSLPAYDRLKEVVKDVQQGQRETNLANLINVRQLTNNQAINALLQSLPGTIAGGGATNYIAMKLTLQKFMLERGDYVTATVRGDDVVLQLDETGGVTSVNLSSAFRNLSHLWGVMIEDDSSAPSLGATLEPNTRVFMFLMSSVATLSSFTPHSYIRYLIKLYQETISERAVPQIMGPVLNATPDVEAATGMDTRSFENAMHFLVRGARSDVRSALQIPNADLETFTPEQLNIIHEVHGGLSAALRQGFDPTLKAELDRVFQSLSDRQVARHRTFVAKLYHYLERLTFDTSGRETLRNIAGAYHWTPPVSLLSSDQISNLPNQFPTGLPTRRGPPRPPSSSSSSSSSGGPSSGAATPAATPIGSPAHFSLFSTPSSIPSTPLSQRSLPNPPSRSPSIPLPTPPQSLPGSPRSLSALRDALLNPQPPASSQIDSFLRAPQPHEGAFPTASSTLPQGPVQFGSAPPANVLRPQPVSHPHMVPSAMTGNQTALPSLLAKDKRIQQLLPMFQSVRYIKNPPPLPFNPRRKLDYAPSMDKNKSEVTYPALVPNRIVSPSPAPSLEWDNSADLASAAAAPTRPNYLRASANRIRDRMLYNRYRESPPPAPRVLDNRSLNQEMDALGAAAAPPPPVSGLYDSRPQGLPRTGLNPFRWQPTHNLRTLSTSPPLPSVTRRRNATAISRTAARAAAQRIRRAGLEPL